MATIKLGTTKTANALISYAEKRAERKNGLHCSPETAKAQFKATREMWGKNDGIQAHHVIQSFKPEEITPEKANQLGQELGEKLGKGHEVLIYTHSDKKHIHNHLVINSVNFEDGYKFQLHGKKGIEKVRNLSDEMCKEHGLSIVDQPAPERYHQAEYGLAKRGIVSWKDELRQAIDLEKQTATSFEEFQTNLKEKYDIDVSLRGKKSINYKHPTQQKNVRGKRLGANYERSTIENVFTRESQSREKSAAGRIELSRTLAGNEGTQRPNEKLHLGANGQGSHQQSDGLQRDTSHRKNERTGTRKDDFDYGQAKETIHQSTRANAKSVEHLSQPDARTRRIEREEAKEIEQRNRQQHEERTRPPQRKQRGMER
jgi:hypothetical protein